MYSSESDSDRELTIPSASAASAQAAQEVEDTYEDIYYPDEEGVSHMDSTLSVEYVERCAVLIDFKRLLEDDNDLNGNDNAVVEGYAQILHFPLCLDVGGVQRVDQHLGFWNRPSVSAAGLSRVLKQRFFDRVNTRVVMKHGIAPNLSGVDPKLAAKHDFYIKHLNFVSSSNDSQQYIYELSGDLSPNLWDRLTNFFQRPLRCCKRDGVPEAIAFLTTQRNLEEVKASLEWLELGPLKLKLPRYRLFTLDELAGEQWAQYEKDVFIRDDPRCPIHRRFDVNVHDNKLICCRQNVFKLWETLNQGALLLQKREAGEREKEKQNTRPFIEEDEDDE